MEICTLAGVPPGEKMVAEMLASPVAVESVEETTGVNVTVFPLVQEAVALPNLTGGDPDAGTGGRPCGGNATAIPCGVRVTPEKCVSQCHIWRMRLTSKSVGSYFAIYALKNWRRGAKAPVFLVLYLRKRLLPCVSTVTPEGSPYPAGAETAV